jgi:D-3-phosphoglycerate dehydrogenase
MRLAICDDYQRIALASADWSGVGKRCDIRVFERKLEVPDEAAEALADFEILCLMRERMPLPRALLERLPRLKMIGVTGAYNRTLDLACATERGIVVSYTPDSRNGLFATAELTWGLLLAAARHIPQEHARVRGGGWQNSVGTILRGKTLGLLGLGRIGREVAGYARAFGMKVQAWSQNLTPAAAAEAGVSYVDKAQLFRSSDVISIHLVLSERTRGLVGAAELALMKPTAILVNTARGPVVDTSALVAALNERRIAGAAIDVYDVEPLPPDHPLRGAANLVMTPHLGYMTSEVMRHFFEETIANVQAFLDGQPIRLLTHP